MKKFTKSTPFKVLIIVICAALMGTVIAVATTDSVSPVSTVVGTIMKPVQNAAGTLAQKFANFGSWFSSSKTLQAEVERLEQQVAQYQQQLADYEDMKQKVNSYESMLDLKESNPDYTIVYTNIIGTDTEDPFGSFILNKGETDGIKINDPVVSGECLVGVVKKVNQTYCIVETILNPDVNISAAESKTREASYVTSTVEQAREGRCVFEGLERTTAVSPGGIIETSGVGGIYPKGLLIGTVSQVLESEYDITSYALVTPAVDFDTLESVFVITAFSGQGVAEVETEE